jgi:hypothetical protein
MRTANPRLEEGAVFEPTATHAMSLAFEEICRAMKVAADAHGQRNAIATRIVQLARSGELDPNLLRDRLLREAQRSPSPVLGRRQVARPSKRKARVPAVKQYIRVAL